MDQQELRQAVLTAMGGRSVRTFAADLGLPKSTLHDFLSGRRDVSPDPILAALYREQPDLRRLLETYHANALQQEAGTVAGARRA